MAKCNNLSMTVINKDSQSMFDLSDIRSFGLLYYI